MPPDFGTTWWGRAWLDACKAYEKDVLAKR